MLLVQELRQYVCPLYEYSQLSHPVYAVSSSWWFARLKLVEQWICIAKLSLGPYAGHA